VAVQHGRRNEGVDERPFCAKGASRSGHCVLQPHVRCACAPLLFSFPSAPVRVCSLTCISTRRGAQQPHVRFVVLRCSCITLTCPHGHALVPLPSPSPCIPASRSLSFTFKHTNTRRLAILACSSQCQSLMYVFYTLDLTCDLPCRWGGCGGDLHYNTYTHSSLDVYPEILKKFRVVIFNGDVDAV
jgi:hypothetical protein